MIGGKERVPGKKRLDAETILRLLAEHVPGAVYLCRNDARYSMLYLNRAVEELTGWAPRDFLEDRISFVDLFHPDDRDLVVQGVSESIAARRPFHLHYRLLHRDGSVKHVEERGQAILDEQGHAAFLEGTIFDVTDRVQAAKEQERLRAQLLQTQRLESLGIMAGGIAHDFNNLLTIILGGARLALVRPERVNAALLDIVDAAERAALLTRNMLAYSGRSTFEMRPLDVAEHVRAIGRLIEASISKKVSLKLELADGLPTIVGDPAQLQQIVMNLVINGAEAIGDASGTVVVRTSLVRLDDDDVRELLPTGRARAGTFLRLEVEDTGAGMDASTLARVFDPFFTTKSQGRGLGLSAVIGIVGGHGGGLSLQSAPGRGTVFRVHFPVSARPVAPPSPRRRSEDLRGAGTVLVVDDDPSLRTLARASLTHFGYEVIVAENGTRAVELFRERPTIDVVLLDMSMPDLDGAETLRALRQLRSDVRVLLSSGFSQSEATRKILDERLVGFLAKPWDPERLAAAVKELLAAR